MVRSLNDRCYTAATPKNGRCLNTKIMERKRGYLDAVEQQKKRKKKKGKNREKKKSLKTRYAKFIAFDMT